MSTTPRHESEHGLNLLRWGTKEPLRLVSLRSKEEVQVRAFGTATVDGREPDVAARQSLGEAITQALGEVLSELDRSPEELPGLCAEAARLTLPRARALVAQRGVELRDLTIEGLAVAGTPPGERRLTPEPRGPEARPRLDMERLMRAAMSRAAPSAPTAEGVPELGELVSQRATVPHAPAVTLDREALRTYLEWVASGQGIIPWEIIDSYAAEFFHPQLLAAESLLVAVDTDQERVLNQAELTLLQKASPGWPASGRAVPTRPLTATEALCAHARLMLLGDTGSGKTMTARALCAALARAVLEGSPALEGWHGGIKVPLYVRLRELSRGGLLNEPGTAEHLWRAAEATADDAGRDGMLGALADVPDGGLLWVLDGLDELRDMALLWGLPGIQALMDWRAADSFWVLSRSEPVISSGPALAGLARARLLPLDERAGNLYLRLFEPRSIDSMVRGWYQEAAEKGLLAPEKASGTAESLLRALEDPDLRQMASRPLLLAEMILFQATRDPLPGNAGVFCREAARLLTLSWAVGRPDYEVRSYDPVSPQHLEAALGWLATVLVKRGAVVDGRRVLDRAELVQELTPLMFDKAGVAEATLEVLLRRGGLLTEAAPGKVGFVYEAMAEPCQELGRLR